MSKGFTSATITESLPLAKNLTTLLLNEDCEVTAHAVAYVLDKCRHLQTASFRNIQKGGGMIQFSPNLNLRQLCLWCQHRNIALHVSL